MSGCGGHRDRDVGLLQSSRHRFEIPRAKQVLAPIRFKRDWEPASRYWERPFRPSGLFEFRGQRRLGQSIQAFVAVPQLFGARAKILSECRRPDRPIYAEVISFSRVWEMRISSYSVERPMCLTCKHRMGLARISPGKRGFEERTFECSTCHRLEKVSIAIDPLKTDAVGWLASELRPPR